MNQLQLICSIKSNVYQSVASDKMSENIIFRIKMQERVFTRSWNPGFKIGSFKFDWCLVRTRRGPGISDSKDKINACFEIDMDILND